MGRFALRWCAAVLTAAGGCGVEQPVETSSTQQYGVNMQGVNMQGVNMQGVNMQGVNMQGFELGNATLTGNSLSNLHVERGELVANRGATTLRGTQLTGVHLFADGTGPNGDVVIEFRVSSIMADTSNYDPTHTGGTYLYTLEQWVDDTGTWQPACGADYDGRHVAIPVTGIWNTHGDRIESSTQFTMGCTTGVIAKCYRWGYKPWLTGYGADMTQIHWTCTRMARADYCGDGTPHTHDGTAINVWDTLAYPGPIQRRGFLDLPPVGMFFEAGWSTGGAVCLSHARWLIDFDLLSNLCPDRLIAPGLLGETVCDTLGDVTQYDADASLFDDSYPNL
jgi:ADYC domain-containing protein/pentapeptide repeat protein